MVTGSHLDSVRDGGAYDGPLGVVSALAAVDLLRERGFTPTRRSGSRSSWRRRGRAGLAASVAADDRSHHARRGRSCATATGWPLDAMAAAGLEVADQPEAGPGGGIAERIGCFVELHVEQGRDLVHRDAPVGVAAGSGRTAGTASTSTARRPRRHHGGWRTGATRC